MPNTPDRLAQDSNSCHGELLISSRRRHTRLQGDWSSDVCSSDLHARLANGVHARIAGLGAGDVLVGELADQALGIGPGLLVGLAHDDVQPHAQADLAALLRGADRKSTRLNSSHLVISYAVFCLTK